MFKANKATFIHDGKLLTEERFMREQAARLASGSSDVTPSETVIGTALDDSKPIHGTDLHEVDVLIGGGTTRQEKPRAELGSVWKHYSKVWLVKSNRTNGAGSSVSLIEIGGSQRVTIATTYCWAPLDAAWTFLATDMAAFEKMRAESAGSIGVKVTSVDGRRVPQPGDVWRDRAGGEFTFLGFYPETTDNRARWHVLNERAEQRVAHLLVDGTLSDAWTFVRSANEKPKPCLRCLWSADKCACNENVLAVAGGSEHDEENRVAAMALRDLKPHDRFELYGHKVTIAGVTRVFPDQRYSAVSVVTDGGQSERLDVIRFAKHARRLAGAEADRRPPFGCDVAKLFASLRVPVLPPLPTFDFRMEELPTAEVLFAMANRSRLFRSLTTAFESLSGAMQTERGSRICNEQLVRDATKLCPPELDRRGFVACLSADCEREANSPKGPMDRDAWKALKPAEYAADIAMMIRNEITLIGWKGPNKNPMVGIYERAIATPKRVEGKWLYRKSARR